MKKLLTAFLLLQIVININAQTKKEFVFTTSDTELQKAVDWAKSMALSYVGNASDPVGPWYEASLPQREAFCMRDVSHQSGGGEILGLSSENFNMFHKFVQNISESKDWCTFWEIDLNNKPAPVDYRNEKEFWYNLNANFDVLDACYRTYLWTGDKRYISDPDFLFFYEKTMADYIDRWQLQADRIMDRPRFMNSPVPFNINDSFHKCRGLPSYVENFEGLTVSADLIASIYRACISYSEILRFNGSESKSNRYIEMAKEYANLLESKWWDKSKNQYNTFYTDNKEFHRGEGETFILWFGATENPERIRKTLSSLLSAEWNVENLSYFPQMLYSFGYNKEAYEKIKTLHTTKRNEYPEVSYGLIEGAVAGLAGIRADASRKEIRTLSGLSDNSAWINLDNLPIFGESVSIRHEGTSKSMFENHTSSPILWKAAFPGTYETINLNGKKEKAKVATDLLGNPYSYIEVEIKQGKSATATTTIEKNRWSLQPDGGISWIVKENDVHTDHIEMSGKQVSVILTYGTGDNGNLVSNKLMIFPMLRVYPNDTHGHSMYTFDTSVSPVIQINNEPVKEKVKSFYLKGFLRTISDAGNDVTISREFFPSTDDALAIEKISLHNNSGKEITVDVEDFEKITRSHKENSVYDIYEIKASVQNSGVYKVKPGDNIEFSMIYSGRKINSQSIENVDVASQWTKRREFVDKMFSNIRFTSPDPVLNRMFDFAKIRAMESIYETKGGLVHGPGGSRYYAAIWANDQAEYANPFFAYTGYPTAIESAMVSWRWFAKWMNPEYKPIPSSIVAEGDSYWNGAGDRGDQAMIAYGATRFALALGDKEKAKEIWPLIEWCLEFCKRKVNANGVVASDSDELENRFPSGDANLCTSSLYYDALVSAVDLGKAIGVPQKQLNGYAKQAKEMQRNINSFFGAKVQGFDTYRYYDGNDILRSWICVPLTVNIFERSKGTINALFSPYLWTKDGLLTQAGDKTFWDRSTLYGLRGAFAAGATEEALPFFIDYSNRRLLGDHVPYAVEAWPEGNQRHLSAESALYCRVVTEGLFGFRPTGLNRFVIYPQLPDNWNEMALENLIACGGKSIDIFVKRSAKNIKTEIYSNGKLIKRYSGKKGQVIEVVL